jgi:hypothetical protein
MDPTTCKAKITGLVSYLDGPKRVAAPYGVYEGRRVDSGLHLSRADGLDFDLSAVEASTYLNNKTMKIISGRWP